MAMMRMAGRILPPVLRATVRSFGTEPSSLSHLIVPTSRLIVPPDRKILPPDRKIVIPHSRLIVPAVIPTAANGPLGTATSFVIQVGSSVYQIIPPSETDAGTAKTIQDYGYCGVFPTGIDAPGGLVFRGFSQGLMSEYPHLSQVDYDHHMKTYGAPDIPSEGYDGALMQIGVYPSDNYAWMSLFDFQGHECQWVTTYAFLLRVVLSSGVNFMKYESNAQKGLVFQRKISRDLMFDFKINLESHYILDKKGYLGHMQRREFNSVLERPIDGRGKLSKVYQGHSIIDINTCAVKEPGQVWKAEPRESFVLKHTRSKLIRHLICAWKDANGKTYLAFKLCARSLLEAIENEPFDLVTRRLNLLDACMAVKYCKDRNIMHRDINYNNLLRDDNDDVLLSDFGFAEVIPEGGSPTHMLGRGQSGLWCAPELMDSSRKVTMKAEVYSLGVLKLTLLTEGLDRVDADAYVKRFANKTKTKEWRENPMQAFRNSEFFKPFRGNPETLLACISNNPEDRISVEDLILQVSKG